MWHWDNLYRHSCKITKAGTTFNEKAIVDAKTHFKWQPSSTQANLPWATTENANTWRSLTRIEQPGSSSKKRRFGHIRIYERLFVAYNYAMCISMFLLKFFLNSKSHFSQSKHRDQRIRQEGVAFKRPKKWSRSLTGGGRLLEVPTVRLRLGNCSCFG